MILDATTKSLEVDLNGAVSTNQLPFVVDYCELTNGTQDLVGSHSYDGATNSTTAVTILAAPGANLTRVIKKFSIYNADTAAVLLWIQLNNNATLREIIKVTMAVGDTLAYTENGEWKLTDSSGQTKLVMPGYLALSGGTLTGGLTGTTLTLSGALTYGGVTLAAAVTGTGNMALSADPTFTGTVNAAALTLSSTLTLSGTAANIALGSNYISYGGTDAGLSFDASNNATFSANLKVVTTLALGGSTPNAAIGIYAAADYLSGANQYGLIFDNVFSGTTSSNAIVVSVAAKASTAITTARGIVIGSATLGGGASITTNVGLDIADQTVGSTDFAIRTGLGNISFGDTVSISGATTLNGNTTQAVDGIVIGAAGTDRLLDDASNGAGTAALYIGNAQITAVSDIRLKSDVRNTSRDALDIFSKLRVVDHTWNDPSDIAPNNRNSRGVWTGLIAQEAIAHIPWIVNRPLSDTDEQGREQYWFMDYNYMAPLFVRGFQQLETRLIKLEKK